MAGISSGIVLCPHCGRPFKRLKSHLPHCKMVGKQMNPQTSGKALSPSVPPLKSIPDQIHLSAKEKKQKKENLPFGQTRVKGERKTGKSQIAVDSYREKPEFMPSVCTTDTETGGTSLMKSHSETVRPVTVETNTSACLKQSSPMESIHLIEVGPQVCASSDIPRHQLLVSTESGLPKRTAECPSETKELKPETHLYVGGSVIKMQAPVKKTTVASRQKKKHETHTSLPIVAEEDNKEEEKEITDSQQQVPACGQGVFSVSINNSMSGKLNLKSPSKKSLETKEHASLTSKRKETLTFVEEECKKIDIRPIETTKLNPVNEKKENEASLGVMKTFFHDSAEDLYPQHMIKITGDKYHRQKLEQENKSLVEKEHLHHSDHSLLSSKPLSPFQRIDAKDCTIMSFVQNQSKERTGVYTPYTQQRLENLQQSLPTLSVSALKGDREWMVQHRDTTPCIISSTKAETACLSEISGSTDIRTGSVGLQWLPQFYVSYQHLGVLPGKKHSWEDAIRTTGSTSPGEELRASLLERRLMNVSLGELPSWLTTNVISPRDFPAAAQRVWGRYYNKYINVKKGGIGGITMLLAGYCTLSYVWNYKQISMVMFLKQTAGENITDDRLCTVDYNLQTVLSAILYIM